MSEGKDVASPVPTKAVGSERHVGIEEASASPVDLSSLALRVAGSVGRARAPGSPRLGSAVLSANWAWLRVGTESPVLWPVLLGLGRGNGVPDTRDGSTWQLELSDALAVDARFPLSTLWKSSSRFLAICTDCWWSLA